MKFLKQKDGFLGYDANTKIKNKVVVVPFGLEKTVSYGSGTKNAPKEIIKASHQVELFDEELNKETFRHIGIKTLKPFKIKNQISNNKQTNNLDMLEIEKFDNPQDFVRLRAEFDSKALEKKFSIAPKKL